MEFLLQSLLKGKDNFLQVLSQAENFSDFEVGVLLGIVQNHEFLFLRLLRKAWEARKDLRGLVFKKFVLVFLEAVQGMDQVNLGEFGEEVLGGLEFIGCYSEGIEVDLVQRCFVGTKKLFVGKVEMVRVLGLKGFDEVDQELLNKDQAKTIGRVLDRNVEEIEVSKGCKELDSLGKRLRGKENKVLYEVFIGILVYLCEVKGQFSHAGNIESIINESLKGLIKEVDRPRVSSAFDQLCQRVNFPKTKATKEDKALEAQILGTIEKASSYFFAHSSLDPAELNRDLRKINHKPSPNLLYRMVSDMIYYDEPSAENFKYWSQFLEALENLPNIRKPEFLELKKLASRLSGKPALVQVQKKTVKKKKAFHQGGGERKQAVGNSIQAPGPKPSSIQAEYQSLSVYHSQLSESALSLIKDHSATATVLEEINEATKHLRAYLKSFSPSCTLKFIGSAVIGTYLKGSFIDILVQDPLKPVSTYLASLGSGASEPGSCLLLNLPRSKYSFCAHTENLLQIETSALIRKYCQIDTRINGLILFVKIWAKGWNIKVLNGFHWSLLTLVFILNTEPSIVPNLQLKKHSEKLIEGVDTWFDSEYSQVSPNYWSLGELIFHFFHFFSEDLELVADLKTGKFLEKEGNGDFLVALHPFTGQSISQPLSQENRELIQKAFKATFGLLVKSEPISNILNFH